MARNRQDILQYWNAHVMGTQFLCDEEFEINSREYFERLRPIMFRHEYLLPLIDKEAMKLRGSNLLEVGSGMGFDALEWARRDIYVTSVDLASNAVQMAQHHAVVMGQRIDLGVASALMLPFTDATFDVVYSRGVLHITGGIQRAITEIHRVLKPGGRLIVANLYNRYSWFVLLHSVGRENIVAKF